MGMTIRVDNAYSDGHESQQTITDVDEFTGDPTDEDALRDHLFEFTGDGHGDTHRVDGFHEVTILVAANEALVGRTVEFG